MDQEMKRIYFTRAFRWSIFSASLTALSLAIWKLTGHTIPANDELVYLWIKFPLPFAVSRWWDILALPMLIYFFVITCLILENPNNFDYERPPEWRFIVMWTIMVVTAIFDVIIFVYQLINGSAVFSFSASVLLSIIAIALSILLVKIIDSALPAIDIIFVKPLTVLFKWLNVKSSVELTD